MKLKRVPFGELHNHNIVPTKTIEMPVTIYCNVRVIESHKISMIGRRAARISVVIVVNVFKTRIIISE